MRRELVAGTYRYTTLGAADDIGHADGRDVLTYEQARKNAGARGRADRREDHGAHAIERYLVGLAARSDHAKETRQRAEKWIIPALGHHRVDRLTKSQIEAWRDGMVRDDPDDDDAKRRSPGQRQPRLDDAQGGA